MSVLARAELWRQVLAAELGEMAACEMRGLLQCATAAQDSCKTDLLSPAAARVAAAMAPQELEPAARLAALRKARRKFRTVLCVPQSDLDDDESVGVDSRIEALFGCVGDDLVVAVCNALDEIVRGIKSQLAAALPDDGPPRKRQCV